MMIYDMYFVHPYQFWRMNILWLVHTLCCVYSTGNTQGVDGDHYAHPQPCIKYDTSYEAISLSSQVPTKDVDEAGYLRPQPSIQYVESHQAVSSPNPTTATDNKPSSSEEYCYVTPRSMQ